MDFTNFTYTTLPSPSSIRLLSAIRRPRQLLPPSISGHPLLEYVLETVDINDAPEFDLISSTWGNPCSGHPGDIDNYGPMNRYPIVVNGKLLFIPRNIYEALKMAREVNDPINRHDEPFGETALLRAAEGNRLKDVEELLRQGAHVHAQDCVGKTALHYAAENGRFSMISILLDYGASMNVVDSYGRTPLDYFPYLTAKQFNRVEEIAYKMHLPPESRQPVSGPEVVRVGKPMWIDAICIDQSNTEEKSNHSSIIGHIYARARSVVAWVGVMDDKTRLARQAIRTRLLLGARKAFENEENEISAIAQLLRRSWFERPDLIHEVAFGRPISVYCGTNSIPLSDIMQFLRTQAHDDSLLPTDLQVWSLIGSRDSKKRRSDGIVGGQKRSRLDETRSETRLSVFY